jgi:DNA polymerase-3 subunit gamma/tau
MDNFIVSARKYRPSTFSSVVGQNSITTTLKNAIKNSHLAHAYLFCGPRGVGKTTCARIFAKTINCFNITPEFEACNECDSCKSFNENRSYNIHELDAASNNTVDGIRNLIEQVRIPPQVGKYSLYIIDEVHMLSSQAFNAFLKTLEEPPAHAVFILATTEKHKIIPTILSRCQIFDFNRITIEDIAKHLLFVAKSEKINADADALTVIAQKADGSLRDSLSIFDQIVSFSGTNITYKDVISNLNILDYEYYRKLTTAFLSGDISTAFLIFDEILSEGFDAQYFITGLSEYFRDLLVCKDKETLRLLEVGANIKEVYKTQSEQCSIAFLYKALNITSKCDVTYKIAINKRLLIEIALLDLCSLNNEFETKSTFVKPVQNTEQPIRNVVAEKPQATIQTPVTPTIQAKPQTTVSDSVVQKIATTPVSNVPKPEVPIKEKSISIKGLTNSVKEPEVKLETANAENQAVDTNKIFTQTDLTNSWNEFSEKIKTSEPRIYSIVSQAFPQLIENNLVELSLTSELQSEAIKNYKTEILSFLKQNLKNEKIEFIVKIVEETKTAETKKIYTTIDKYKYLSDLNPELDNLKNQFSLDFN